MTDRERVTKRLKKLIQAAHNDISDFVYITVETAKVIVRLLDEQERDYIVRCKDCKYLNEDNMDCNIKSGWFRVEPDWFCADGEVRK